ncbi:Uncharacterized protein BXIN_1412 [Babesia sp. Xinjiang]|uniref:Uncharacterized protein n=1 Tax=Babesia sp. Xinjiang TaxID=462227 RepID=UPI000A25802B|nr:Uncharacterized protein BXIN_1412 [Babesia sp. Xinjiang]ORM39974.1 Uncharacterized protein BXIN_1412 [Babesia sp. Xinjiang]
MVNNNEEHGESIDPSEMDDDLQRALELSLREFKKSSPNNLDYNNQTSGFFGSVKNKMQKQKLADKIPNDKVSMRFILDEMDKFHEIIKNGVDTAGEQNICTAKPITEKTAKVSISRNQLTDLLETLFGTEENRQASSDNIRGWCRQGFSFQPSSHLFWGLKQQYGGPCGVLASVQSFMLQCLLFHNSVYGSLELLQRTEPAENVLIKLREVYFNFIRLEYPEFPEEWLHLPALLESLCVVLYNATRFSKYKIILFEPLKRQNLTNALHSIIYDTNYIYVELDSIAKVASHFLKNIHLLMSEMGVMSFTLSVLATRGIENLRNDMDDPTLPLIGIYGHSSQELVNLLLQGKAVSNIFDGEKVLQDGDKTLTYKLRGITGEGNVGFLTEREASRHCQAGSYYKNPRFPVWVTGSFSHYTVLFAVDKMCCRRTEREIQTENVLNVWGCLDTEDNKFITADLLPALLDMLGVQALQREAAYHVIADSNLVLQGSFMEWYLSRMAPGRDDTRGKEITLFHYNGQDTKLPLTKVSVKYLTEFELQRLRKEMSVETTYGIDATIVGFTQSHATDLAKTIWTRWPNTRVDTLPIKMTVDVQSLE